MKFDLPFLTRALDALPFLQTREPSQLKVSGEAAYMSPDPNTKKSPIPSDNGEGIAYIDDFEAARRNYTGGDRLCGMDAGEPARRTMCFFPNMPDTTKMYSRGKMVWFNRLPTDVQADGHLSAETSRKPGEQPGDGLDFRYFPTVRGQYNTSLDLETTLTLTKNWGAVMKPLSVSAINLSKENINFIEIWMRDRPGAAGPIAKMFIDLGSVSEDAIPNRALNSEDLVLSSYPNGVLQDGEDVGLDMLNELRSSRGMPPSSPNIRPSRPIPAATTTRSIMPRSGTTQEDLFAHQRDGRKQGRPERAYPRHGRHECQRGGGPGELVLRVRGARWTRRARAIRGSSAGAISDGTSSVSRSRTLSARSGPPRRRISSSSAWRSSMSRIPLQSASPT